jgi:hypothetical protein
MVAKKKKKKIKEIRIGRPSELVLETVEVLAEKEGRTIASQANYMLEKYIEQNKL